MVKVITYGTYDLLHYGHIRLLERAKALGDYLIVGVTSDDFDKTRGKINVQQSLMERLEAARPVALTASSRSIREEKRLIKMGLVGNASFLNKVYSEASFVNGLHIAGLLTSNIERMNEQVRLNRVNSYEELLQKVDAVYIRSLPELHYQQIKEALENGKNVLCESPITLCQDDTKELIALAKEKKLILMEAIKTAYATAFDRLLLLIKGGKVGKIISVDATCTSLKKNRTDWPGFYEWAPTALLPIFEILGTNYKKRIYSHKNEDGNDTFAKIDFQYEHAVASIKVGDGIKSEGELIISGTNGYIYVPAPWWKTDYFEIRYENAEDNKRYFYQLDGEGIRYELVTFVRAIERGRGLTNISNATSNGISKIMEDYKKGKDTFAI